jgi:hypothetical protein
MRSIQNEFLAINGMFQRKLHTADLIAVRKDFFELDGTSKKKLLNRCGRMLSHNDFASVKNEAARVAIIKLVIAAFPDSSELINNLLRRHYVGRQYEVLFTLFCFSDRLLSFKNSQEICNQLLSFVRDFLLNVKNNTCHAAWMAGDLLGAHWRLQRALPVLFEAATHARYAAGREAAVDGLAKAFERTNDSGRRKQIVQFIQDIHTTDRSHIVRLSAQLILAHCRMD